MALGKPSPLSIGLSVVLIGIIGYLIYVATTNVDTSTENYTKGAANNSQTTNISPTVNYQPLSFGCAPIIRGTDFKIPPAEVNNPVVNPKVKK
jgi:hypothetical protein